MNMSRSVMYSASSSKPPTVKLVLGRGEGRGEGDNDCVEDVAVVVAAGNGTSIMS